MDGLVGMEIQLRHRLMCGLKRFLKFMVDGQMPVEIEGVMGPFSKFPYTLYACRHFIGPTLRIINDDLIPLRGLRPECLLDKGINDSEIAGTYFEARKN